MSKLDEYMNEPVSRLVADSPRTIGIEEAERHRIYSLLLMSMVAYQFNGNKRGVKDSQKPDPNFDYGLNPLLTTTENPVSRGLHLKRDYLGHNIAAFAVDRDGYIVDFDFNHNEIFNSSVQHAEARLLNRVFSLNQINDSWNVGSLGTAGSSYGHLLKGVTVYTSLESCAQCSGIMTLGNAKEVVFLQDDPGQYRIGNILYRLTESSDPNAKALAPRPISSTSFGFEHQTYLQDKFAEYKIASGNASITSFLCTDAAFRVFLNAEGEFAQFATSYPEWKLRLPDGVDGATRFSRLSNQEVLAECRDFYQYFVTRGRRGTPH